MQVVYRHISPINNAINIFLMQMLTSELFDGEIEEADVLSRQMELAEELYRSEDYLLPAVPIRVHVLRNSPGEYLVLLQDQYLYAFVQ